MALHFNRPAWAEIDLGNFRHNIQMIARAVSGGTRILAVVKADAYGIGVVQASRVALTVDKVAGLAVATPDEALDLRDKGFDCMILVLGPSTEAATRALVMRDISFAVSSLEGLTFARRAGMSLGRLARVHLKVDTGMSRVGFRPGDEFGAVLDSAGQMSGLEVEGIFTHFSVADTDAEFSQGQIAAFEKARSQARERGVKPRYYHAANSAGIFNFPEAHYDLVRPGIVIYGSPPDPCMAGIVNPRPVVSIKARISHVKRVPPGTSVGYGRTFITKATTTIATIPIGYADGIPRSLSNTGSVLIRGKRLPIAGRVCMDQIMVDVGDMRDISVGETVTLIGRDNDQEITVDEVAQLAGTIPHEVLTGMSQRLPRIYI